MGVTKSRRIWALGMKNWVELREAEQPPRIHTTKVVKSTPRKRVVIPGRLVWNGDYCGYIATPDRRRYVSKPITISTSIFIGGKVIKSVKARQFSRLTKISVGVGGVIELLPEHIAVLTEKGVL